MMEDIFLSSDKLLSATTQLTDPNKLQQTVLQIDDNGDTHGVQKNERVLSRR